MFGVNVDPRETWRSIRGDAKTLERNQLLERLEPQAKEHFKTVERYIEARGAAGKLWRSIYLSKASQSLSMETLENGIYPKAQALTELRDTLGGQIALQPERHQTGLDFFGITKEKLEPARLKEEAKVRVNAYHKLETNKSSQSVLERAKLAREILLDSKGHAGFIKRQGVSWKQLGFDAKIAEQGEQFANLSKEERHAVRVIRRYQEASRKSGQAWHKVFKAKAAKRRLPEQRSIAAHALSNQRNALAAQLLKHPEKYDLAILAQNINEDKLYEHAYKHLQKEVTLKENMATWGALQKSLISLRLSDNPSKATHQIADWLSLNESTLKGVKGMEGKRDSLAPAARTLGFNERQIKREVATLNSIQKSMQKLITKAAKPPKALQSLTQEQHDKLNKISRLFKETKPIEGTLAERYLREHRGVKGLLPVTFRFHPGIRSEGKDRPALVVIGRNEEDKLRAAQLIYLDPKTANKADVKVQKRTLGIPAHDTCGVLINQGKEGSRILVAEGPETALSIREANPDLRIYASLGSNNFGRVPLPNGVKEVLICADNDGGGAKDKAVLNRAKEVLTNREVDVLVSMPKSNPKLKKVDFNDVLKESGAVAVIEAMKNPIKLGVAQNTQALISRVRPKFYVLIFQNLI